MLFPNCGLKKNVMELVSFIKDKENVEKKAGLLNVKKAEIVSWQELPIEIAKNYISYDRYYMPKYGEKIKIYYIAFNYEILYEDKYHINGINYRLGVVVHEEGQWKLVALQDADTEAIIAKGYGLRMRKYPERKSKFIN